MGDKLLRKQVLFISLLLVTMLLSMTAISAQANLFNKSVELTGPWGLP
jgi:hypothetical protein